MARRRIEKSGSSLAITLPEDIVERLGLDEGAEVSVSVDSDGVSIRLTPVNVRSATGIDHDFAALLEGFTQRYHEALKELAQR